MNTITIPDHIKALAQRLNTQDNRITADPMFCVQESHRIYGIDPDHYDNASFEWVDDSGEETEPRSKGSRKVHYITQWRTVMVAFTEQACKDYIAANGHNHQGPLQIYAESFHRCDEMIQLRKWLMSLAD